MLLVVLLKFAMLVDSAPVISESTPSFLSSPIGTGIRSEDEYREVMSDYAEWLTSINELNRLETSHALKRTTVMLAPFKALLKALNGSIAIIDSHFIGPSTNKERVDRLFEESLDVLRRLRSSYKASRSNAFRKGWKEYAIQIVQVVIDRIKSNRKRGYVVVPVSNVFQSFSDITLISNNFKKEVERVKFEIHRLEKDEREAANINDILADLEPSAIGPSLGEFSSINSIDLVDKPSKSERRPTPAMKSGKGSRSKRIELKRKANQL
jgi:hypothetical protein